MSCPKSSFIHIRSNAKPSLAHSQHVVSAAVFIFVDQKEKIIAWILLDFENV
jgi:hypothetical protein